MSSSARADLEQPVRRAVLIKEEEEGEEREEEEGGEEGEAALMVLVGDAEKPVSAKDFAGGEEVAEVECSRA